MFWTSNVFQVAAQLILDKNNNDNKSSQHQQTFAISFICLFRDSGPLLYCARCFNVLRRIWMGVGVGWACMNVALYCLWPTIPQKALLDMFIAWHIYIYCGSTAAKLRNDSLTLIVDNSWQILLLSSIKT